MPAVYRVGRRPDPWEYPDWSRANPDGTFGNRFDDPNGEYRIIYASSARLGCFLETLARYRPDLALYAELDEIEGAKTISSRPESSPANGSAIALWGQPGPFRECCTLRLRSLRDGA